MPIRLILDFSCAPAFDSEPSSDLRRSLFRFLIVQVPRVTRRSDIRYGGRTKNTGAHEHTVKYAKTRGPCGVITIDQLTVTRGEYEWRPLPNQNSNQTPASGARGEIKTLFTFQKSGPEERRTAPQFGRRRSPGRPAHRKYVFNYPH
ncbi:hypothetical protein EVAR_87582_1 [Eumeta japonica]|uniref:Uncharacterized protein n=1 Tax=Eumeta variegata TaxID=151549 RepID=A0A4C1WQ15_EUMVA|nr:hypothetical protein EVAR_87582_1 [Eumeta japonica]